MTDDPWDDDEYEEDDEPLGPSLALPPLYVLRTAERCPECGQAMHVYSLGCTAFADAEFGRPNDPIVDFHFLRRVESVPAELTRLLQAKCPSFFPDTEDEGSTPYLMNHCSCGARLDDDFISGDVGAAFWPDTPEGYRQFRLFQLPIDEPIPVVSSYMIGGGEYLDFAKAEAW